MHVPLMSGTTGADGGKKEKGYQFKLHIRVSAISKPHVSTPNSFTFVLK